MGEPEGPRPPDFVGVGAQRCGTTWWFELLCEHPDVRPASKELHFFDAFCAEPMSEHHVELYHRQFVRRAGERMGEWTPRYAHDFWTPELLHRAAPEARLLLLVRDPIARLRSGVVHQCKLTPPTRPVELATIYAEAAARSCYGQQLARLLRHFDREQILVLQYERCRLDPGGELARTFRFVGLDDAFVPPRLSDPRGTSSEIDRPGVPRPALEALANDLAADVAELAELVPDLDLTLWGELRDAAPA